MGELRGAKSKEKLVIVFLIISVIVVGMAFYVLFLKKEVPEEVEAVVLNAGDLAINYLDGNEINVVKPKNDEYKYIFSITNTGVSKLYYSIYLDEVEEDLDKVNVVLERENGDTIYNNTLKNGRNLLIKLNNIEASVTERFVLKINNDKNKKNIKAKILVVNESISEETFADTILDSNVLSLKHTTPGVDLAVSHEGLVRDEDELGTTYYFRGKVENNYLQIGDYLFRIVRINGDGTVRIVLDQSISLQTPFNSENINVADTVLFNNSLVYQNLNNWVDSNLSLYKDYFVEGDFCSDNNFINYNGDMKNSNVYQRIFVNANPSLKCNGQVSKLKVGLLSADEVVFAGAIKDSENKKFYLYNPTILGDSWTTSSSGMDNTNSFYMINITKDGGLKARNLVNTSLGVRPVLNLSVASHVKGEGTKNNPYVLVS